MAKYSITIMAALLAISAQAQQLLDAPAPKSTTIVITLDSMPAELAYKHLAHLLMDEGFTLAKTDKELYLIGTDWKEMGGFWHYRLMLNISIRELPGNGCQVRLSGKARTENIGKDAQALLGGQYNDMEIQKRTAGGKYWEILDALALKVGGSYQFF